MTEPISFFVPGVPAPGGSKKAFGFHRRNGTIGVNVVDDAKRNAPWRAVVAYAAREAYRGTPLVGALEVRMEFTMPRLKSHFHTGKKRAGELRADAPIYHVVKPDALKLTRSTEDACTGILWHDDACNAQITAVKRYGDRPGVTIVVRPMT